MYKLLNPNFFQKYNLLLRPYFITIAITAFVLGLAGALITSPEDYQQGEMVRILYIHVPSAWMSLMIFMIMGLSCFSCIIWKAPFSFYIALASAPVGACFSGITLITGMIWGYPIWGTWWVWDARLTSMLILFIFYICFLGIVSSSKNINKIEKPACVVAILGMINVPIVKFSVNMWYSLHQSASVFKAGGPAIDSSMLIPLIIMFIANFSLYCSLVSFNIEKLLIENSAKKKK